MPSYYCHQCERPVRLRDGDFICASCGSDFVEEMSMETQMNMSHPFASLIESIMEAEGGRHHRGGNSQAGTSSDGFHGIRFSSGPPPGGRPTSEPRSGSRSSADNGGHDHSPDAVISTFLNQLLSNLSAQGAHIQLQISRDPHTLNVFHRPVSDYVIGDGGLDEVVTQLLNQFEGGSTPVDQKHLQNLPMTTIDSKLIDDNEKCPTCMEFFIKDERVSQLDCHHYFHRDCILPWFRRHNTCPVCRQVVDAAKWPNTDPLEELD